MKRIFTNLILVVVLSLFFGACSHEEDSLIHEENKATLSFGAVLNDLVGNTNIKQQLDIPSCSEDAPAFVDVVLSGTTDVGSTSDPLRLTVNPSPIDYNGDGIDEYFTEEHMDLELEPGPYSLDWFVVRNQSLEIIWIAPFSGGSLGSFVNHPLPLEFNLGAGVKKYVNVDVLCFDDREVNAYGYSFFELDTNKFFKYCFFANFYDRSGRHYPAAYSVDIRLNNSSSWELIYSDVVNNTGFHVNGDAFAEPLCFALPDLPEYADDENYLSYRVTLLDWEDLYGEVPERILNGFLSRNDIISNFEGENGVAYNHLKFELPPEVGDKRFGGIVAYIGDYYVLVVAPNDLPPSNWETAVENSRNLSVNGFEDWFLPSRNDLMKVINHIDTSGSKYYWSFFTLGFDNEALAISYRGGIDEWYSEQFFSQNEILNVRPIRIQYLSGM